jgi:hypothetical protein
MSWSPTTAPHGDFGTVYLVMDSFGDGEVQGGDQ